MNCYDIIIDYEGLMNMDETFLKNIKCKKIVILEDLHFINKNKYDENIKYIDKVLLKFNIFKRYDNVVYKNKYVDFPMYCTETFLTDKINFNSINKIVMYGNINRFGPMGICRFQDININQYFYRKMWKDKFEEKIPDKFIFISNNPLNTSQIIKNYSFGFVCTYFPYQFTEECRISHDEKNILDFRINNDYKNLNESYMIAKFFEIPGNGLLLLADTKHVKNFFDDYGFVNFQNYIEINNDNFDEIINFISNPNNQNKIKQIRINGYNHIKNNHLVNNRIEQLKKIIDLI